MKRALHFATKLISRDIQKCKFWKPSYDLLVSARKALFPAPTSKFGLPLPPPPSPNQKIPGSAPEWKIKRGVSIFHN